MDVTGFPETGPTKVGVAITDCLAAQYAVQGILLALITRGAHRRGPGRRHRAPRRRGVDPRPADGHRGGHGQEPGPPGQRPSIARAVRAVSGGRRPGHRGRGQSAALVALLRAVGLEDLEHDPRFATNSDRLAHRVALNERIAQLFARSRVDELIDRLTAAGVPCGRVRSIDDVLRDPQLAARHMLVEIPAGARVGDACRAIPSSCRRRRCSPLGAAAGARRTHRGHPARTPRTRRSRRCSPSWALPPSPRSSALILFRVTSVVVALTLVPVVGRDRRWLCRRDRRLRDGRHPERGADGGAPGVRRRLLRRDERRRPLRTVHSPDRAPGRQTTRSRSWSGPPRSPRSRTSTVPARARS